MKLAEALIERADLQRKLAQLKTRIEQNAQYQEGEQPSENPLSLLAEYRRAAVALQTLVISINQANHRAVLADGSSMSAALTERDRLKNEAAVLVALANAATPEQSRYSRSEIKMLSAVDVADIRKQADEAAKQTRLLDIQIQQANWANDL